MLTRYLMNGCTIHGLIAAATATATAAFILRFNRSNCHRHASFGLIDIGVCTRYVQYISFCEIKATTMEKMNFASYLKECFFYALTCHEDQKCLMHLIWFAFFSKRTKCSVFWSFSILRFLCSFGNLLIQWNYFYHHPMTYITNAINFVN